MWMNAFHLVDFFTGFLPLLAGLSVLGIDLVSPDEGFVLFFGVAPMLFDRLWLVVVGLSSNLLLDLILDGCLVVVGIDCLGVVLLCLFRESLLAISSGVGSTFVLDFLAYDCDMVDCLRTLFVMSLFSSIVESSRCNSRDDSKGLSLFFTLRFTFPLMGDPFESSIELSVEMFDSINLSDRLNFGVAESQGSVVSIYNILWRYLVQSLDCLIDDCLSTLFVMSLVSSRQDSNCYG